MPAVSVIVPVYNAEKYLEQCLDSIVCQTLEDIEIICVNDGSTDESQKILERYAQNDKRIKIEEQKNQGLSCARNRGMELAHGEYIGFVDSDDFIAPQMMEKLYMMAKRHDAEIAIGDVYLYDHNTQALSTYRDQEFYSRVDDKCIDLETTPELIGCIGAWDRIYLRCFLEDIRAKYPPGMIYEDAAFTADTLTKAKRITLSADKLYYYRKNAGASITDKEKSNDLYKKHFLMIQKHMQNALAKTEQPAEVYTEYIKYFIGNAFAHQMYIVSHDYFKEFFSEVRAMLFGGQKRSLPDDAQSKLKLYAFLLGYDLVRCCQLYFTVRKTARRIIKGQ